jgi:hypothetical protein
MLKRSVRVVLSRKKEASKCAPTRHFRLALFCFLGCACCALITGCHPMDKFVFMGRGSGMITEGSVGFVSIGDDFLSARKKILGYGLDPPQEASDPNHGLFSGHKPPKGAVEYCFADTTWRRGDFCISDKNGKVASIVWAYNPLTP